MNHNPVLRRNTREIVYETYNRNEQKPREEIGVGQPKKKIKLRSLGLFFRLLYAEVNFALCRSLFCSGVSFFLLFGQFLNDTNNAPKVAFCEPRVGWEAKAVFE